MAADCAPLSPIVGPPPTPPLYSLIGSSRVVDDLDGDQVARWGNGVVVYPYPTGPSLVHDAWATGSDRVKADGGTVPAPEFGAMTVYLAETCSALGIFGSGLSNDQAQDRFVARANAAFTAIESAAVEREFFAGDVFPLQPFLSDGNGTFPTVDVAQTVVGGFGELETAIADSGRGGVIHVSPAVATAASFRQLVFPDVRAGVLRTILGTPVIPGDGYADSTVHPAGHAAAAGKQEWIYATGPVEIRRSPLLLFPGELSQALDRGQNTITYRAERFELASWDTVVQAAVLVDRST